MPLTRLTLDGWQQPRAWTLGSRVHATVARKHFLFTERNLEQDLTGERDTEKKSKWLRHNISDTFGPALWSSGVYQWNKPIIKPQKSKLSNTVSVWWTVGEHMSYLAWLGSSLGSSWGRGVHGWIRCWILSACLHADNLMNVSVKCCEVCPESLVQSPHRHTVCYPGLDVVKQMQILNFLGATFTPSPLTNCKERQVGLEHQGIQPLSSPRLLTIPISKSCQHRALCLLLAFCCGVHLECLGTLLERLNLAGISKRRYIQY